MKKESARSILCTTNQIDSDMYYEYDQTGQWIRKTAKNNPEITEQKVVK